MHSKAVRFNILPVVLSVSCDATTIHMLRLDSGELWGVSYLEIWYWWLPV